MSTAKWVATSAGRRAFLTPMRFSATTAVWQNDDLVFATWDGNPVSPRHLLRDYEKWVSASGVPRIRIHDIRHTVITQALASGVPIKALPEHVGHARTSITLDIYAHALPEHRREVADTIGATILGEEAQRTRPDEPYRDTAVIPTTARSHTASLVDGKGGTSSQE